LNISNIFESKGFVLGGGLLELKIVLVNIVGLGESDGANNWGLVGLNNHWSKKYKFLIFKLLFWGLQVQVLVWVFVEVKVDSDLPGYGLFLFVLERENLVRRGVIGEIVLLDWVL
jgi:hypothetical protein